MDFESFFAAGTPAAAPRWSGFPRYNFTGGHNAAEAVPVEWLAQAAADSIREEGHKLATYNMDTGPLGHRGLRDFVAGKLRHQRGIAATADDVLVTTGSLQGLDLVNALLLDPGDVVIMEEFSYSGAINKVRKCGGEVVGVPLDGDGVPPEALAEAIDRIRADGKRLKYVYLMPTIQNPTGSVMPEQRRSEIISICNKAGALLVEDECYADLVWEGEWPTSLRGMPGGENVIHIGSFSKSIAPALRLGYINAPQAVLSRLVALKGDGGTPALSQMVVARMADRFDDHVRALKQRLSAKLALMRETVAREFGTAAETADPKGGIFLWLQLPPEVDTSQLAMAAAAAGVAINPGAEWSVDPQSGIHSLRLCFAHAGEDEIREGVTELARICHRDFGIPRHGANRTR
ncbi:MAG: PLP-dependent aminotransferase family protein [Geminicoccaceae bacterium]|nr:PLP-dependent aminotransferase family protein [Geminicoccaceae bacterium]